MLTTPQSKLLVNVRHLWHFVTIEGTSEIEASAANQINHFLVGSMEQKLFVDRFVRIACSDMPGADGRNGTKGAALWEPMLAQQQEMRGYT